MQRANLADIQIFMAVVEAGSFVAGGRSLGLSRSAAGKAVARLEDRLGTRLLNRTTRALSLTEEGRSFYDHGLKVLAAVDEAEAGVARGDGTPRGVLRLTVPDAFGRLIVMPILRRYLAEWPDLQAEVSFSDRVVDLVEDGFDLALRVGVEVPDTGLIARTLARHRALLCAAPGYLEARGEPRDVEDLREHDCLYFTNGNRRQSWGLLTEQGERVQGRSRLRLDSGEALRDAAVAGLGIAYLPEFLAATDLAAGRLRSVLADRVGEEVRILALYPDKRLLAPRVRRFIDLLAAALNGEEPR